MTIAWILLISSIIVFVIAFSIYDKEDSDDEKLDNAKVMIGSVIVSSASADYIWG